MITLCSATDTENTAEYTFGVQYKDGSAKSVTFNDGTATESSLEDNVEALKDVTKKEHGFLITLDSVEKGQHFANLFPKIAAGDDISIKVQAYYLGTDKVCIAKRNFEMTQNSLFARVRQEEETSGGAIKRNPKGTDVVITKGSGTGAGLFGVVSKELTIENLKMKDCVVNTKNVGNVGMLIGQVNAQPAKQVMITGCGT